MKKKTLVESLNNALIVMRTMQAQIEDYSENEYICDVETGINLSHIDITKFIEKIKQELSENG